VLNTLRRKKKEKEEVLGISKLSFSSKISDRVAPQK
jgi:hypothetical protein